MAPISSAPADVPSLTAEVARLRGELDATARVMRAVQAVGADPQPVFDAIAESAAQLTDGASVILRLVEGDFARLVAHHGADAERSGPGGGLAPLATGNAPFKEAIRERRTVHIHDSQLVLDRFSPESAARARRAARPVRSALAVPLLRPDGEAIGSLQIRRFEVRPFTPEQIRLVELFAAQAVVALEKTTLLADLQRSNASLTDALERERATGEVLRVIAASPTDLRTVLEAIAVRTSRLVRTRGVNIVLLEGDHLFLRAAARDGAPVQRLRDRPGGTPLTLRRPYAIAAAERRVVHVPDIEAAPDVDPRQVEVAREAGWRSTVCVPLLGPDRTGAAIGSIGLTRAEPEPFSEQEISLLQTFADQAVIAIENARLFSELRHSGATLREALDQQTATAEVLRAISAAPGDLDPVLEAIATAAATLCGVDEVGVRLREGQNLRLHAAYRHGTVTARPQTATTDLALDRTTVGGRAAVEQRTVHVPDLAAALDEFPANRLHVEQGGIKSVLAVPLLHKNDAVGVMVFQRKDEARAFTDQQVRLLESFADQAVIALENARLFSELNESNATLKEALEQQTATSEVLRAIAATPTDLERKLDTIADAAIRLCGGADALIWGLEEGGTHLRVVGRGGSTAFRSRAGRMPVGPERWPVSRAFVTRQTVHLPDMAAEPPGRWSPAWLERLREEGTRAFIATPLVRDGRSLGVLVVRRHRPEPFTPAQISLLETFASQAVIAIENERLFTELRESNATLKESLEQQTATADILRVIASSPTDLQEVLDAIAVRASRLVRSFHTNIHVIEGTRLHNRAHARSGALAPGTVSENARREGVPLTDRRPPTCAVAERRVVHVVDMHAQADSYPDARPLSPARTMLVVPMLRGDMALGAIALSRGKVEPFTDQEIAIVQSFADQAVIAIENARLFSELEESNATLKDALEQQTATGEVLRVIASSPADLQRVLDTIASSAGGLIQTTDVQLFRVAGDRRVLAAYCPVEEGADATIPLGHRNRIHPRLPTGWVVLERRTLHVADIEADERFAQGIYGGCRTMLAVPMLREHEVIGVILLRRREVRPFDEREVTLVETFAAQAVVAVENTRLFSELQERDERRRLELERASALQQRLLPSGVAGWPGVLDIAVRFRPAVETSGDFYDALRLTPSAEGALPPLQIAVGDVAGKGMAAALVTALARSALHTTASIPSVMATPATTLRLAGQRLHRDVGGGHFVACALAIVEPPGQHNVGPLLRLANAAQVPVLLVRGGTATEIEPPGYRLPLGSQADGAYRDAEVELRPGDVVVFSSDGLVEAPSLPVGAPVGAVGEHLLPSEGPGDLFGFARLSASVSHWASSTTTAEDTAAGIWNDLTSWCGDQSHHDDMTLLVLRVPA